jgi:hypothetical protein
LCFLLRSQTIAHRLDTILDCDRILILDAGAALSILSAPMGTMLLMPQHRQSGRVWRADGFDAKQAQPVVAGWFCLQTYRRLSPPSAVARQRTPLTHKFNMTQSRSI